jgi:hypothetical protein
MGPLREQIFEALPSSPDYGITIKELQDMFPDATPRAISHVLCGWMKYGMAAVWYEKPNAHHKGHWWKV